MQPTQHQLPHQHTFLGMPTPPPRRGWATSQAQVLEEVRHFHLGRLAHVTEVTVTDLAGEPLTDMPVGGLECWGGGGGGVSGLGAGVIGIGIEAMISLPRLAGDRKTELRPEPLACRMSEEVTHTSSSEDPLEAAAELEQAKLMAMRKALAKVRMRTEMDRDLYMVDDRLFICELGYTLCPAHDLSHLSDPCLLMTSSSCFYRRLLLSTPSGRVRACVVLRSLSCVLQVLHVFFNVLFREA